MNADIIDHRVAKARLDLMFEQENMTRLFVMVPVEEGGGPTLTMCTNGRVIRYGRQFVSSITDAELKGVLFHEYLHVVLRHHVRIRGRDYARWNAAADAVVNGIVVDHGYTLPAGGVPPIRGKSVEEVYADLPETAQLPDWGLVEPYPDESDSVEHEELLTATIQNAISAWAGDTSSDLFRELSDSLKPAPVPWHSILEEHMLMTGFADFSMSKFSRRHIARGLYMPSLRSPTLHVAMALDSSGSMDDADLALAVGTVKDVLGTVPAFKLVLYVADMRVQSRVEFDSLDDLDAGIRKSVRGGGGTDYRPVFKAIESEDAGTTLLLYFTDGQCTSFPARTPEYSVIWVMPEGAPAPPFGAVVTVSRQ